MEDDASLSALSVESKIFVLLGGLGSDRSDAGEGATANRFIDPNAAVWPLFAHDSGGGGGSSLPASRVPRGLDVSRSAAIPKFSRVPMPRPSPAFLSPGARIP